MQPTRSLCACSKPLMTCRPPAPPTVTPTPRKGTTAVRQGASWTAAYHRQLTVAAVARPIGSSVGAPASLRLRGPGCCSPRRRLPGGASSRSRAVGRRRRGRPCQQARHGVGRRCPAGGVHPSGLGVRDPAVQPSGVRSPGVVVQRVRRPAVCCPPVRCPAVSCLPPSVRTRPSPPMLRRWRWGPRSRWPGDRDHRNRWRPRWLPSRRRLDRRSTRPGRGRRCRSRVDQWEVGGGPGPPGWVRAAAAALAR
jgi:hypothetical protein